MKMESKYIAIGLVVAALIVVGGLIYMNQGNMGQVQTVTTMGNSLIEAQPEKVVVYFEAKSTKSSAEAAKDAINLIVSEMTSSLLDVVSSKDIETEQYTINEEYDYTNGGSIFKGYTARQMIKVSTEQFEKAGRIVDKGVEAGALVSYINFELTKETENELKAQALEQASADAKMKAEATAKGLNAKLGKLVSVQSNDFSYYPYRYWDAFAGEKTVAEATTNIQPNQLEITASVSVVYKIN